MTGKSFSPNHLEWFGIKPRRIGVMIKFVHVQRSCRRSRAKENLYSEALRVVHVVSRIFKQTENNLGQIAQLCCAINEFDSTIYTSLLVAVAIATREAQYIQHGVKMRFRCEVQASLNTMALSVDLQICTVVHVDHVPAQAKSSGLT